MVITMRKSIFYLPALIFTTIYVFIAINDIGSISPIVIVWLILFFLSGFILSKNFFWGALFGTLPAFHLIYMGTQNTGQIFSETPIGIIILVFYIACGYFVYRNTRSEISNS